MANALPSQIFDQFKGIREYNGINHSGQISALSCQNVELFKTDIGNGTGIRTVSGDKMFVELPSFYKAIKNFTTIQDNVSYMIIYAENETENKGKLFYVDIFGNLNELNLPNVINTDTQIEEEQFFTVTGKANGLTMAYGEYDIFVFTNGEEAITVNFSTSDKVKVIEADWQRDDETVRLKWLSMAEWNGQLVIASQYGVHGSHKNDIYSWNDNVNGVEDSWYIEFGKKVTAVHTFSTGLFIFTNSDCSHLNTTPNDTTNARLQNVAMNGCFSFESIVAHDTYLFFYDDNQKGVFYIQMTDTGQTRPAGSVTKEIQSFLTGDIKTFKMYSCIYSTYNEIWLLINDKVVIYDYSNQEFVERKMHKITGLCMYKNRPYVCNDLYEDGQLLNGQILAEKISETYSGEYYPAEYKTSVINMGSNSNLKKQKTPLLLVLNENAINNFYVEITANFKTKNPKPIRLKVGNEGLWASDDDVEVTDNMCWDKMFWASEDYYRKRVVEISTPQTWYTMSIRFFTLEEGDGFNIVAMELKRLKEKTKTKGR